MELVKGELVAMTPVGFEHGRIVLLLGTRIVSFAVQQNLGVAGSEIGFVLARHPDTVRAPDIAFVKAGRIPATGSTGFFEGPPDLAIEVLSPGDKMSEVQQKIREYLAAGACLVWIVDPGARTVSVYHPSGDAHIYSGNEPVPGGDVLPGFSLRPSELFKS